MTIETEPIQERLRPRILQTEETGRLDLNVGAEPEANLPALPTDPSHSSISVAATGLAILVIGLVGVDLVDFIGGAFAHGPALGIVAAAAVAAVSVTGWPLSYAGSCGCAQRNACEA